MAGGSGTRLFPLTLVTSKQLLPVYDKPMIYYPLSSLMLANIYDILIISTKEDINRFKDLLGDGSRFGINLSYAVQEKPNGLAEAFIIGKDFIGDDSVCMVLGDNIFYGNDFKNNLFKASENIKNNKATIFGHYVSDPTRFGIVELQEEKVISIEEKPLIPKSNYAVVGLYFYPNDVINKALKLTPSIRNELEITDINKLYLAEDRLNVITFGRGFTWLDTGTFESLALANEFVRLIEENQGLKISCPEEIAYINGWINKEDLKIIAMKMNNNQYGKYLLKIIGEDNG